MKDKENKSENMQKFSVEIKKLARDLAFANTYFDCSEESLAEYLIDLGYQKLPKDSVVLSREEYESDLTVHYEVGYEFGSKETAEKIIQMINDDRWGYWDSCDCGKDETYWRDGNIQGTLNEIAKEFGIEIKE